MVADGRPRAHTRETRRAAEGSAGGWRRPTLIRVTGPQQPTDAPARPETEPLAVHVNPTTGAPLGIWGPPGAAGGPARSAYIAADAEAAGREDLAPRAGEGDWSGFVSYLSDRSPHRSRWERVEAAPGIELGWLVRSLAAEWVEQRWHAKVSVAPDSLAEARYLFAADRALRLACEVGGPEQRWVPEQRVSTRLCMFGDDDRLVIVVGPQEPIERVDLALAYGLAYAGDRDLVLVLPAGSERATVMRAPWIDVPLEVWVFDAFDQPVYQVLPYPDEVLGRYRDEVVTGGYVLGPDRAAWVDDVVKWADRNPDLIPGHRPGQLAWQCRGKVVLRIAPRGAKVEAIAGVQHAQPPDGHPPAVAELLAAPLSPGGVVRLLAANEAAVARRLSSADGETANDALKRALAHDPALLGLVEIRREFPAFRPPMVRSYMDFLGADDHGRLHVIETKIGDDEMLVLQGLDYWIWAQAHRRELAALFGLPGTPEVVIDFVTADPGQGHMVGPYTASQAEALAGGISWQFHHVSDWLSDQPVVQRLAPRFSPEASHSPRLTGPRQAVALGRWYGDPARNTAPGQ
jgi:hypothetical protein